ncbi:MAG: phosphotransferase [Alphaproteobacteria bacterium]|nr:phosphotransferase [Alphaproteobacteria bacterium]
MAILGPVTEVHRFDEAALTRWLDAQGLPGIGRGLSLRQFQGGQSNPTFLMEAGEDAYVLRKKPPGALLPSAHMVEREYRVMQALGGTDVPVPVMRLLCEDVTVIGTAFYVMDYLDGRIPDEPSLDHGYTPEERTAIWDSANDALAKLHSVDHQAVGLGDFGRPAGYCGRQVARWTKQFEASKTDPMPDMDALIAWLNDQPPPVDEVSIVHGDYRLPNLMLHPTEPRVIAILDWELATLGHPLSDLAYTCMPYRMPCDEKALKGMVGLDLASLGIPSEDRYLARYFARTGRDEVPDMRYFHALSFFRLAAICQGVYARGLQGNASSADALEVGAKAPRLAEIGWAIARNADA